MVENYSDKILLIIGAGPSQAKGIQKAASLGCCVMAIDVNPKAPGFSYAQKHAVVDLVNIPAILNYVKDYKIDGVTSFSTDIAIPAVAAVAQAKQLPGFNERQVQLSRDKYEIRQICQKAKIPGPHFYQTQDIQECFSLCHKIKFPCIIKPVDASGSRGVTFVGKEGHIEKAFLSAKKYSKTGRIIIEEYMEGLESSVEGFKTNNGVEIIALSDKERTPPPFLLDAEVIFPTRYDSQTQQKMKDLATQVIEALNISSTPFHMEVMMTKQGPRLVEVGFRGPGFKVFSDIIPRVSGVDVLKATIDIALGYPIELNPQKLSASVIKFIAGKDGVIKTIKGLDKACLLKGIEEIVLYVKPGDQTHNLTCGNDRLGHIIAYGETREETLCITQQAFDMIKIFYE